jgi:hypothetical protein
MGTLTYAFTKNLHLSRVTVSALAHPYKCGLSIDKLHRFLQPIHQVTRQPWCFFRTSRRKCSNTRLTIGSIGGMLRQPTDTMLICRLPPHSLSAARPKPRLPVLRPSTALAPLLRTLSQEMGTKYNTRKACRAFSLENRLLLREYGWPRYSSRVPRSMVQTKIRRTGGFQLIKLRLGLTASLISKTTFDEHRASSRCRITAS